MVKREELLYDDGTYLYLELGELVIQFKDEDKEMFTSDFVFNNIEAKRLRDFLVENLPKSRKKVTPGRENPVCGCPECYGKTEIA